MNEQQRQSWITKADPAIAFTRGLVTKWELIRIEGIDRAEMIERNLKRFIEDERRATR